MENQEIYNKKNVIALIGATLLMFLVLGFCIIMAMKTAINSVWVKNYAYIKDTESNQYEKYEIESYKYDNYFKDTYSVHLDTGKDVVVSHKNVIFSNTELDLNELNK